MTGQPEGSLLNEVDKQRFQAITGSIVFLTQVICYDCMYAISQVAQGMSEPPKAHMAAAKHLLRYLAGTTNFSIVYKDASTSRRTPTLTGATTRTTGRSMSSNMMMMGKAQASFTTELQSLTAMSTTEAELIAATVRWQ